LADGTNGLSVQIRSFGLDALHGNARRFGSDDFFWGHNPLSQHLADSGSGNIDAIPRVVRACLGGRQRGTAGAVENFVEESDINTQFLGSKTIKNMVTCVFVIKRTNSGVISPDQR